MKINLKIEAIFQCVYIKNSTFLCGGYILLRRFKDKNPGIREAVRLLSNPPIGYHTFGAKSRVFFRKVEKVQYLMKNKPFFRDKNYMKKLVVKIERQFRSLFFAV